ncbi:MAG: CPBP family glutamic-type intramembrane protease [Patescibacteria group bacterium]
MEILNIKIKSEYSSILDQGVKRNFTPVFAMLGIGVFNILIELFSRHFMSVHAANILVESFHVLIYFGIPLLLVGTSRPYQGYAFVALYTIATSLLYALVELQYISTYCSVLFIVLLFIYILCTKKRSRLLIQVKPLKEVVVYSLTAAFLIIGHVFFVVSTSTNYQFNAVVLHEILPKIFYMVFGIFGMEVFFRGYIFNQLNRELKIPFWISAGVSTILFMGPFLVNPFFTTNIYLGVVIGFYLLLIGFVCCALAKKTKSIIPPFVVSLVIAIIRYSVIFGPI